VGPPPDSVAAAKLAVTAKLADNANDALVANEAVLKNPKGNKRIY
jgi:hypothetical protein